VASVNRTSSRLLVGASALVAVLVVAAGCGEPTTTTAPGDDQGAVETTTTPVPPPPASPPTTVPPPPLPVGSEAMVDGVAVMLRATAVVGSINEGLAEGRFLRAEVVLRADDAADRPYAPMDFALELPDGATLAPLVYDDRDRLGFGTLGAGQVVEGVMAWDLGDRRGPARVTYTSSPDGPGEGMPRQPGAAVAGREEASWQVDLGAA
jgi:hypothetical protein